MKTLFIYILLLVILTFGCNEKNNYKNKYTLVADTNLVKIRIDKYSRNLSKCVQFITISDTNYLYVLNDKQNSIEIYNFDKRTLFKNIFINLEGSNSFHRILGFSILSKDIIIVISQMPQFVALLDRNGQVLKKIPYSTDNNGRRTKITTPLLGQRAFIIGDTLYLSQRYKTDETYGILSSEKQKITNLEIKLNIKTGICVLSSLLYPEELIGLDISGMEINRVRGHNDCLLYHFGMLNTLFVSYDNKNFNRVPIESNYRFQFPQNQWEINHSSLSSLQKYEISKDCVQDIYYDNFRGCYFLFIRRRRDLNNDFKDYRTAFVYPNSIILILDKKFKYLGEVYLPDNIYSIKMSFISKKGLYVSEDHVENPDFDEDYMCFRLFKLVNRN